ncbi:hypothetical protein ACFL7D_08660 [candidate division KSB1 bacterium]
MSIYSVIEGNVVVNTVDENDTLNDIFDLISKNIDEWVGYKLLWDLSIFNFLKIDSDSIHSFIQKIAPLSEKHSGQKDAILAKTELGFGMMRMLQILAENKYKIEIKVFREKDEALKWLKE